MILHHFIPSILILLIFEIIWIQQFTKTCQWIFDIISGWLALFFFFFFGIRICGFLYWLLAETAIMGIIVSVFQTCVYMALRTLISILCSQYDLASLLLALHLVALLYNTFLLLPIAISTVDMSVPYCLSRHSRISCAFHA